MLQRFSALLSIGCLLLLAASIAFVVPADQRLGLLEEYGPTETVTAVLYLITAGWLLTSRRIERTLARWTTVIVFLGLARELDLQGAFTTDSISKSRYYLDGSVPLPEKILAVIFVLLCVLLLVRYLRYWPKLVSALRAREPFAYAVVAAILLAPISKVLDGAHRTLEDLTGQPVSDTTRVQFMAFEETFELGIPLMMLLAIALVVLASRRAQAQDPDALPVAEPGGSSRR